ARARQHRIRLGRGPPFPAADQAREKAAAVLHLLAVGAAGEGRTGAEAGGDRTKRGAHVRGTLAAQPLPEIGQVTGRMCYLAHRCVPWAPPPPFPLTWRCCSGCW